jgi:hypothetical protein
MTDLKNFFITKKALVVAQLTIDGYLALHTDNNPVLFFQLMAAKAVIQSTTFEQWEEALNGKQNKDLFDTNRD